MTSIQIILEPNYVKNAPQADIYINNGKLVTCEFTKSNQPIQYDFDLELQSENTIRIHRYGKTNHDVVLSDGDRIEDQSLHIKNILIDKIPLENLLHLGIFFPDYPEPWATTQRNEGIELPESETYMSDIYHNGNWHFNFDTPIHPWFFANLNISI